MKIGTVFNSMFSGKNDIKKTVLSLKVFYSRKPYKNVRTTQIHNGHESIKKFMVKKFKIVLEWVCLYF